MVISAAVALVGWLVFMVAENPRVQVAGLTLTLCGILACIYVAIRDTVIMP